MSKDTFDFSDLDAILAEFRGEDVTPSPAVPAAPPAPAEPVPAPEERVYSEPEEAPFDGPEEPVEPEAPVPEEPAPEATVRFDVASLDSRFARSSREAEEEDTPPDVPQEEGGKRRLFGKKTAAEKPAKPEKAPKAKEAPKPEKPPKAEKPPRQYKRRRIPWALQALLALLFTALTLAILAWVLLYLHPASGSLAFSGTDTKLRLSDKLDVYVNNAAADAMGDLAYIRKIYTLQESLTVAPAPDPNGFGVTYDPAEIEALISRASILLDGQRMTFDPSADFVPDEPIRYYFDDTILVVAWKEYIEQRCCTFAEVKIAHGSQLRRKLAEDSYSSSIQLYASDMASASNAVVAMNGDFYAFRDLGITAYQRKLYRNNPAQVDSCFFTASGDMLFSRAGELTGEGETERFMEANDVVFAVAFGPVLVDNGELQYCAAYPIGEINTEYSRSCIAMTDELHYLLMTINHTPDARPRATINELARIIYSKNVWKAYTLDGGQTAEIIMMGGPINHVDFGYERAVSDIIYFATAIPEEVRS